MSRIFQGYKIIKFQIGSIFGTPIFHEHRLALYKIQDDNELDTKIRGTYKEAPKRTQKYQNVKSFGKSHREFRQDSH